jgi:cytidine deaminase
MGRASRGTSPETWDVLAKAALAARRHAYAPYSRFKVGAALLAADGEVFTGCNVENASYGLCVCAERNAIAAAVSAGRREFHALAVATSSSPPSPPCGMCRQVLAEFCVDLPLLLINTARQRRTVRLAELLPSAFRWKGAGTR